MKLLFCFFGGVTAVGNQAGGSGNQKGNGCEEVRHADTSQWIFLYFITKITGFQRLFAAFSGF